MILKWLPGQMGAFYTFISWGQQTGWLHCPLGFWSKTSVPWMQHTYIYILMNLFMKLIDDLIESILKLPKYLFNSILGGRLQKMWQDGAPQRLRRSKYMTFPVAHECHSAPSLFVASCLQPGLIDACQRQELCDLLIECSVTLGAFNLFRLHAWLAGPQ